MSLTPDQISQLRGDAGLPSQAPQTSGTQPAGVLDSLRSSASSFDNEHGIKQPAQQQKPEPDSTAWFPDKNGQQSPFEKFVRGITQGAGEDIAGAIGSKSYIDSSLKSSQQLSDAASKFLQARKQAMDSGDTETVNHMNEFIDSHKNLFNGQVGESPEKVFPSLDKSNEQVAGDFVNLGAGALSGGALSGATEVAGGGLIDALITGGKIGAGFGAASGAGQAMQNNESVKDVAKDTVVGATEGAITGGVTAGAIHGAASGFNTVQGLIEKGSPSSILDDAKGYVAKKNVASNLGSAVDNLNGAAQGGENIKGPNGAPTQPTAKMTDPLKTYDEFYNQEQKFKGDIKQDTALGMVGSRIGKAYNQVISMRQAAGQAMQDALEKIGGEKTDISQAPQKFETELNKSGAGYDAEKGGVTRTNASKLTSQDTQMLTNYADELNKLGPNPTVKELDAFLSRIPKELDVYKGSNNITKVTNAERMIMGNLSDLRQSISAEANPKFADYAKAKSDYASLTKFLDDGSSFLGGKTASGDYAKDASIAKSSVQSILNGGKKDWLIKLEGLTGYHALDEAMLAIQAMKDAGNFRGQSLLDLLTPKDAKSIPTSPKGFIEKGANAAFDYGKEKFAGTPNEQTRRFIMDRMKAGNSKIPSQFPEPKAPTENTPKPLSRKSGLNNTQGGFAKIPGTSKMPADVADTYSIVSKLQPNDYVRNGRLNLDAAGAVQDFMDAFEKGKATPEQVRSAREVHYMIKGRK